MMARLEFIRREGGNGFSQHQLPQAVLAMKQGAGRLLRDQDDYGVIVLCDPRITTKSYGRVFLRSFEPMPSTSSIDDVAQFLADRVSKGAVA
jgi:ATP-dependent DNA helicase DinG